MCKTGAESWHEEVKLQEERSSSQETMEAL